MEKTTQGAWLLAQSKNLDLVAGAARFETISYAGKVGRLFNVLRRTTEEEEYPVIDAATVKSLAQLNNIDRATRSEGLRVLSENGHIELRSDGSVAVLGATSRTVLEATANLFTNEGPESDECAVIELSEFIAETPVAREEAQEFISDTFKIVSPEASDLIDLCKSSALVDEETDRGRTILFNGNIFKDSERARKAYFLIQNLTADEKKNLEEVEEILRKRGAVYENEVEKVLGSTLFRRLSAIGYFDRMEINNNQEAVGYLTLPDAFQRYGKPFEEDPVDDAKALLASLTYGMTRSNAIRGQITLPTLLLNKLIEGGTVGPVAAIGQDYKELEKRGVVQVMPYTATRFHMRLLKRDVGELALAILKGQNAAHESLLLASGLATGFKGPDEVRRSVRDKNTIDDKKFITDALDRIRSGG